MRKPPGIDPLADKILSQLAGAAAASEIILGGYLALQHHVDYRRTHDIDAWWRERASPATEQLIQRSMQKVAADEGFTVRERRFGETMSFELSRGGKRQFAFQIALRSVVLEPPVESAWAPILLESLADTVGSKMNALVDRGAPRDFLDIKAVVEAGLVSAAECWRLWSRKNPGDTVDRAKQSVLLHLNMLEARRPLESLTQASERESVARTREWVRAVLLGA
ncbi:MAG: nucleotidyl transferase AbiEii/AbiGii toxin family protein [Planctomycetota bacterium]